MSKAHDPQRAPTSHRMSNLFKRRKRPQTVDEEGSAVERKARAWRKIRVSWASKAARADGSTVPPSNLNPRDDDTRWMSNDSYKEEAEVVDLLPEAPKDRFVRREDALMLSTQNSRPKSTFISNDAQNDASSIPANVNDEDLRVAQHPEPPESIVACEAARSQIERGEKHPVLESTPQPIFTSPPSPSPTLQTGVENLNTAVQLPLNGAITAVFSGAQNIVIENVYISVGQGNATNLVAENVRWSIWENDPQFEKDRFKGALLFFFVFNVTDGIEVARN
ncbi:hypothetical protein FA13DRAFT_1744071 [Coprinellus micaceus]|uniref:Uncharacterized protein n=1 Tax=Coprinellus micaceus TaxID=71717 RepID=A0A4Y7SDG1_COPMI|nr:hypothetical protein FA13DRAFT_1744071 [Coprinellus micaceus]